MSEGTGSVSMCQPKFLIGSDWGPSISSWRRDAFRAAGAAQALRGTRREGWNSPWLLGSVCGTRAYGQRRDGLWSDRRRFDWSPVAVGFLAKEVGGAELVRASTETSLGGSEVHQALAAGHPGCHDPINGQPP